jgi:hypothetical protein
LKSNQEPIIEGNAYMTLVRKPEAQRPLGRQIHIKVVRIKPSLATTV